MRKIEKINFLKAVSSVCVSREIFQKLKDQGIGRSLLHLVFLAFLCSCFIIIAGNEYLLKRIEVPLDKFEETVGGIVIEQGAIFPEKDRDRAYEIALDKSMKLIYAPNLGIINPQWINKNGITIVWVPRMWSVVFSSAEYSTMQVFTGFPNSSLQDKREVKDMDDLMAYLYKRGEAADKNVKNADHRTFSFSRQDIERTYLGCFFFYFWLEFCVQTLFITVIFSLFYRFLGARSFSRLNFREIFVSGLYASVPAMLIATLFPALDLPFFDFTTIFLISFCIYFICVLNFLERTAQQNSNLT